MYIDMPTINQKVHDIRYTTSHPESGMMVTSKDAMTVNILSREGMPATVLAGHSMYWFQKGAFYNLKNLKIGDPIYIDGKKINVYSVKILPKEDVVINLYGGKTRWVFITCDGNSFQDRVIVEAR